MTRPDESDRLKAHSRLIAAVRTASDEGQRVPCDAGLLWTTEYQDDEDHEYAEQSAIRLCRACHLLEECRRYVVAFPEPAGIWAGLNAREQKRLHRKESA